MDGHSIRLLNDGEEVFSAMLSDIGRATFEVLLEMYWIGEDEVGLAFRTALARAARRGCAVRVIIDGIGSIALSSGFWDELSAVGGKVATFHAIGEPGDEMLLKSLRIARPSEAAVSGSKYRIHRRAQPGCPVVASAPGHTGLARYGGSTLRTRGARSLADTFEQTWRYVHDQAATSPTHSSVIRLGPRLAILVNTPQKRSGRVIRRLYLWAIRRAQKSIDISAAYFAPRPLFLRALLRAKNRGVRVRILVPISSDVWLARLASGPIVRYLVGKGIAVYAYRASILHAKTAVIDEKWVTVGSHNLDAFSWAWNLECNVAVEDVHLGRHGALFRKRYSERHADLSSVCPVGAGLPRSTRWQNSHCWLSLAVTKRLEPNICRPSERMTGLVHE